MAEGHSPSPLLKVAIAPLSGRRQVDLIAADTTFIEAPPAVVGQAVDETITPIAQLYGEVFIELGIPAVDVEGGDVQIAVTVEVICIRVVDGTDVKLGFSSGL
jgi:hypothetical protein